MIVEAFQVKRVSFYPRLFRPYTLPFFTTTHYLIRQSNQKYSVASTMNMRTFGGMAINFLAVVHSLFAVNREPMAFPSSNVIQDTSGTMPMRAAEKRKAALLSAHGRAGQVGQAICSYVGTLRYLKRPSSPTSHSHSLTIRARMRVSSMQHAA